MTINISIKLIVVLAFAGLSLFLSMLSLEAGNYGWAIIFLIVAVIALLFVFISENWKW